MLKSVDISAVTDTNKVLKGTKMKVSHIFEDQFYLISQRSVARSPLFIKEEICDFFLKKAEYYLGDLAVIHRYVLLKNEFHLLIRTKSRSAFIEFYRKKYDDYEIEDFFIIKSPYIFSQQVSNLEVSLVKKINRVLGRRGTMMDGRYKKQLISTAMEWEEVMQFLDSREHQYKRPKNWDCPEEQCVGNEALICSDFLIGDKRVWNSIYKVGKWNLKNKELRGAFNKELKIHLIPPELKKIIHFSIAKRRFVRLKN